MEQTNQPITTQTLGGVGTARKTIGFVTLVIFGTSGFLSGFEWYNPDPTIVWALGLIGMGLMIAGIAKDITAIAKNLVK